MCPASGAGLRAVASPGCLTAGPGTPLLIDSDTLASQGALGVSPIGQDDTGGVSYTECAQS